MAKAIGVYTTELDVSQFAQVSSPLRPGMVAYASWGPYDIITNITSAAELVRQFGDVESSGYVGLIGIKKYLKYGNYISLVRAESSADLTSVKMFQDISPADTLKVEAKYKGATGNKISIIIETEGSNKKISVYFDNRLQETFTELAKGTESDKNANYKAAINDVSEYIIIAADVTADANTNEPEDTTGAVALELGASVLPGKADFIGAATGGPGGGPTGLQCFLNDAVKINVLLCPDAIKLATEADAKDVMKEVESIAAARKDLVGLVDIPSGLSRDDAIVFADTTAGYNSTYVTCDWPHVQVTDSAIDSNVFIPASLPKLTIYAINDAVAHPWFAAWGYNRGIFTEGLDVEYNSTLADRQLLQDSQINVFIKETGVGIVRLGNFTKYSTAQATQSENIRRMLIVVKSLVATAARTLLAEPHDTITWEKFVSMTNRILEDVKAKRGLISYQVVADETVNTPIMIDNKIFNGTIKIEPAKDVQDIELTFQLTSAGVTFDN